MASSGTKFSMHPHGLHYRYKAMCFLSYFLESGAGQIINNYWMRFFVISGIIKVEVSVISRAEDQG